MMVLLCCFVIPMKQWCFMLITKIGRVPGAVKLSGFLGADEILSLFYCYCNSVDEIPMPLRVCFVLLEFMYCIEFFLVRILLSDPSPV